jgi:solute carrier family 13 (sodium-dependent dicarboxylate transporter), member 2/3/5
MKKFSKTGIEAAGLFLGPLIAITFYYLGFIDSPLANAMGAITILMAIWWMTESVPLSVTSMLPLILFF